MSGLRPGDIVVATRVIVDRDGYGSPFIHAVPGTYGIVLDEDFTPEWPVIKWDILGRGGVCNTPPEAFERYTGPAPEWVVE